MNQIKKTKRITVLTLILISLFLLTGCKISKDYADEINYAYYIGEPMTYNEIYAKLGDTFDRDIQGTPDVATGSCCWFLGYGSSDKDADKCMENIRKGKKVKSLMVQFKEGKAVLAKFYIFNDNEEE